MKVYRSLPFIDTKTLIDNHIDLLGINYEGSNLRLGFCSPSYEYLAYNKNHNAKNNTFNDSNLAKYFYVSLYDALNWSYNRYLTYKGMGIESNFIIWEVDLPDEVIKNNLGVGIYSKGAKIEAKIPYVILAQYLSLGLDNEKINTIWEYFQNHFSWKDSEAKEKLNFDLGFRKVSNPDIILSSDDEAFKSLCFPMFMNYGIFIDDANPAWIVDGFKMAQDARLINHNKLETTINYNYTNWQKVGNKDIKEYLYAVALDFQEENKEIKKALAQNNLNIQKR